MVSDALENTAAYLDARADRKSVERLGTAGLQKAKREEHATFELAKLSWTQLLTEVAKR